MKKTDWMGRWASVRGNNVCSWLLQFRCYQLVQWKCLENSCKFKTDGGLSLLCMITKPWIRASSQRATVQREIVLNSSENKARKENFWQMVKVFHEKEVQSWSTVVGSCEDKGWNSGMVCIQGVIEKLSVIHYTEHFLCGLLDLPVQDKHNFHFTGKTIEVQRS